MVKLISIASAAAILTSGVSSYALPRAAPVDIITASASPTPTATQPSASTLTSTAICLTETNNGIVSTRWITATFWAPVPTSISIITGTGSVTIVTPSATTSWSPPTGTATTRDPWCTIKVPSGKRGVEKRVLPKGEAMKVVKEVLEKREASPGYFEADTTNKLLGQADMLYCPG